VSAFGIAIALQRNPDMADAANRAGQAARNVVERSVAVATAAPAPVAIGKATYRQRHQLRRVIASARLRPTIGEDTPRLAEIEIAKPGTALARVATSNMPRHDLHASSTADILRVRRHLDANLTGEMLRNFNLFLYVSKADSGPLAQRMYVFRKQASGDLNLLYNWPVSTGREMVEFAPNGQRAPSFTPRGYYELDPRRMYKHHVSGQWKTSMPYAMFFNWEKYGLPTGLAIHSATGSDVALLGHRASAGCVRLAPENAAMLFNLIRTNYKGQTSRFAYDRRTASMSNDGLLMHDAQGRVKFAEGYKVLVFIENYGGGNVLAAVF
jgi:hypothetical protein